MKRMKLLSIVSYIEINQVENVHEYKKLLNNIYYAIKA